MTLKIQSQVGSTSLQVTMNKGDEELTGMKPVSRSSSAKASFAASLDKNSRFVDGPTI